MNKYWLLFEIPWSVAICLMMKLSVYSAEILKFKALLFETKSLSLSAYGAGISNANRWFILSKRLVLFWPKAVLGITVPDRRKIKRTK